MVKHPDNWEPFLSAKGLSMIMPYDLRVRSCFSTFLLTRALCAFVARTVTNIFFLNAISFSFHRILNKITPEKFDKLSESLIGLGLNSQALLKGVILLIF